MAKVNLLTIHWGESYGAVMQTYATYQILKNLGHDVTIINLVDYKFTARYKNWRTILDLRRILGFKLFKMKHLGKMTPLMYSIDISRIPSADYTVVGSDQVWNRDITGKLGLSYFLPFAGDSKRLSLSSSFSKNKWNEDVDYTDKVRNELSQFIAISVREKSGLKICEENFGLKAKWLIDPTIALGNYDDLVGNVKTDGTLCCFRFIDGPLFSKCLSFISSENKLPVKYIRFFNKKDNGKHIPCDSPVSWLKEIAKSGFVITDSFHGVVFSILFHKQFITLPAIPERFERIESLLDMLNLSDRIVRSESDLVNNKKMLLSSIDYKSVDSIIEEKRNEYLAFVKSNIL